MAELTVTKDNFSSDVLQSEKPVLLDFWASWCGPCRMLSPIISEIAEESADTLRVGKVNVDEEPELADMFRIESIPTVILFREGKPVSAFLGYRPKEQIVQFINEN